MSAPALSPDEIRFNALMECANLDGALTLADSEVYFLRDFIEGVFEEDPDRMLHGENARDLLDAVSCEAERRAHMALRTKPP